MKPSSSQMTAKMKSFCGSGRYRYFCRDCPMPTPSSWPEPIAYSDWTVCQVSTSSGGLNGSSQPYMRYIA